MALEVGAVAENMEYGAIHPNGIEIACEIVGVDAEGLKNSIDRFNGFVISGKDEDFGRPVAKAKSFDLENGPYYIVKNKLRVATTLGGIRINSDMQVIDNMGNPIEGLYAAGEIVSVYGTFNTMGGLSWALTSGMLAGETIGEDK